MDLEDPGIDLGDPAMLWLPSNANTETIDEVAQLECPMKRDGQLSCSSLHRNQPEKYMGSRPKINQNYPKWVDLRLQGGFSGFLAAPCSKLYSLSPCDGS